MAEGSGGLGHIVTPADRLARIAHDPQHVCERQLAGCGCFLPHLLICTAGRSLGAASAGRFPPCPFIVLSRGRSKTAGRTFRYPVHLVPQYGTEPNAQRGQYDFVNRAGAPLGEPRRSNLRQLAIAMCLRSAATLNARNKTLLFFAPRTRTDLRSSLQLTLSSHRDGGVNGVFEIVRVIGRRFISIAEVHSIRARAHHAQSEPEMARDRFRFLECNGFLNRHREAVAVELPAKPRS